jgi:hypothetical protein
VVDRGVVVCDEWGLVVASANIGEGGFCRMRLPTSIGARLACAATLLSAYFLIVSTLSTQTTGIRLSSIIGDIFTCRSPCIRTAIVPKQLFGRE